MITKPGWISGRSARYRRGKNLFYTNKVSRLSSPWKGSDENGTFRFPATFLPPAGVAPCHT
jgi:hypothetical protein